jgi:hypothetical protein
VLPYHGVGSAVGQWSNNATSGVDKSHHAARTPHLLMRCAVGDGSLVSDSRISPQRGPP